MHAFTIAETLVDAIRREQIRRALPPPRAVGVRLGALADMTPEALQDAFTDLVAGTPLAACEVVIEAVPVKLVCQRCGCTFAAETPTDRCPACGAADLTLAEGTELDLAYLDWRDVPSSGDGAPVYLEF